MQELSVFGWLHVIWNGGPQYFLVDDQGQWPLTVGLASSAAQEVPNPPLSPPAAGGGPPSAPAFAEIPPNASRVTASVLQYSVWPPGSLRDGMPPVRPDQTLYSLTIAIHAVAPAEPHLTSRAQAGTVVEAFSPKQLAARLLGSNIEATLKLRGNTDGERWFISDTRVVP